jgi:hypothetical protein
MGTAAAAGAAAAKELNALWPRLAKRGQDGA